MCQVQFIKTALGQLNWLSDILSPCLSYNSRRSEPDIGGGGVVECPQQIGVLSELAISFFLRSSCILRHFSCVQLIPFRVTHYQACCESTSLCVNNSLVPIQQLIGCVISLPTQLSLACREPFGSLFLRETGVNSAENLKSRTKIEDDKKNFCDRN